MTTFEAPDYIIGNSASITASLSSVLTTLDQALQALQPAPNSSTVNFNDTVRCDAGGNFIIEMKPSQIIQTETAVGTLYYTPTQFIQANSNVPTSIPASNTPYHRVILESAPVPFIDTLVATGWSISSEQINCFGHNGGDMYIGCESGNIYWFNNANPSWDLIMTMDGSIRCLYFHAQTTKMYIGGKFTNMIYPVGIGGLNYICWSSSFPNLYSSIGVDVWNNYAVNGFNGAVNAVAGDSNYLYFGGEYGSISSGAIDPKYISMYEWNSTGNLYPFDNGSGYGFDASVYGLSLIGDRLCATGEFNTVICNMGYITAFYCVSITLIAGFIVNNNEFLFGNPNALANPISILDSVKGDGSTFFISTNDANVNGSGANYMLTAPYNSLSSTGSLGANNFASPQTSFNLESSIGSVGYDAVYLTNGTITATLPFTPYIYWNYPFGRQEFINLGSGQIYAFSGSTINQFTFSSGRGLIYNGISYFTGINFTAGQGYTAELLWGIQGNYYALISNTGGGSPV